MWISAAPDAPEAARRRRAARPVACIAFHLCDCDHMRAAALLTAAPSFQEGHALFAAAQRGCAYRGRLLVLPQPLSRAPGAALGSGAAAAVTWLQAPGGSMSLGAQLLAVQHTAQALAAALTARRGFMQPADEQLVGAPGHGGDREGKGDEDDGAADGCGAIGAQRWGFDPRLLAMEFLTSFLLRRQQLELIKRFSTVARQGRSAVQQMIMGAGKTTVHHRADHTTLAAAQCACQRQCLSLR